MQTVARLLAGDELLLLFSVILLGLLLARLEFKGVRIGLAGVLFAGLGISAWLGPLSPDLAIAPQLKEFGLVLFVYCVGLSSGPGFFSAFRAHGLKLNLAILGALACGTTLAVLGGMLFGLGRGHVAGIFCGALTNTPALGAASQQLAGSAMAQDPVVGYSVTYPLGVLGALLTFRLFAGFRRRQLAEELTALRVSQQPKIVSANFKVVQPAVVEHSIGELEVRTKIGVVVSRVQRGGEMIVPSKYTVLHENDLVTVVGSDHDLVRAAAFFGERSDEHLEEHREQIDMRRVLVSKREHAGRTLAELDLGRRFNAQVTRLRRADLDLVPAPSMRLEMGDRLRLVAPRDKLKQLSEYFGDSERALADIDYVALCLGLLGGLLVGHLPILLFGTPLSLGAAGGPLVVALLLGRLARSGPFVWTLPLEASTTLREVGLLLFLAGVGTSAGGQLAGVMNGRGLAILAVGAAVTLVTSAVALLLAHRWAGASVVSSLGVTSGMQTQPATLAAAYELSMRSEETYLAYAVVYPVAMISKILLAQLLALFA